MAKKKILSKELEKDGWIVKKDSEGYIHIYRPFPFKRVFEKKNKK